jgi:hypothetical protein
MLFRVIFELVASIQSFPLDDAQSGMREMMVVAKQPMGPFRSETRRTNWSYLRHSLCHVVVVGCAQFGIVPPPPNRRSSDTVPRYRNLTFQESLPSTFHPLPYYRSSNRISHTQLGSSAPELDGLHQGRRQTRCVKRRRGSGRSRVHRECVVFNSVASPRFHRVTRWR